MNEQFETAPATLSNTENLKQRQFLIMGKEKIEIESVLTSSIPYGGVQREALTLQVASSKHSLEEVQKLIKKSNLSELKILLESTYNFEDEPARTSSNTSVMMGFEIIVNIGEQLLGYDPQNMQAGKNIVVIVLARKTPQEVNQEKIMEALSKMGIEI